MVTGSLTNEEIDAILDEVVATFNVSEDDVSTTGMFPCIFDVKSHRLRIE